MGYKVYATPMPHPQHGSGEWERPGEHRAQGRAVADACFIRDSFLVTPGVAQPYEPWQCRTCSGVLVRTDVGMRREVP